MTTRATMAKATIITIKGPLSSTPAASAVQNTAAVAHVLLRVFSGRYARARAPMAATTVMSNMASVFASSRSTPNRTQLAINRAENRAARLDAKARAHQ